MDSLIVSIFSPFILLAIIAVGFAMMTGTRPEVFLRPMMTLALSLLKLFFDITTTAVKAIRISANEASVSYSGQRAPGAQRTHHEGASEEYVYNSRGEHKAKD